MFEELIANGYEGTMSRYANDMYIFSRVDRLIKKKSIRECVIKCVGVVPHSNPAKGNIGSLVLEGTINDKDAGTVFIQVKTGSGLSKFDINCEPEYFIGRNVEMLYNSITKTETGYSAFLPRYKRLVNGLNL
jgi:ATP-dependent DNA ligase